MPESVPVSPGQNLIIRKGYFVQWPTLLLALVAMAACMTALVSQSIINVRLSNAVRHQNSETRCYRDAALDTSLASGRLNVDQGHLWVLAIRKAGQDQIMAIGKKIDTDSTALDEALAAQGRALKGCQQPSP